MFLIEKHKDIPFHMTPVDNQIFILEKLREKLPMCEIDLSDGTALIDGLKTDINKAAWLLNKKPPN